MIPSAKVIQVTSTSTVYTNQSVLVAGVEVIGGSATNGADLYDNTSAVAADLKLEVAGGQTLFLNFPIRFKNLHVTLGTGATAVLIHII